MDEIRRIRFQENIRQHIMTLIIGGNIRDPRVDWNVNITRVDIYKDLSVAKIYVSHICGGKKKLENTCKALNNAAGFIRMKLGKVLRSHKTPRPVFLCDERNFEINRTLQAISHSSH